MSAIKETESRLNIPNLHRRPRLGKIRGRIGGGAGTFGGTTGAAGSGGAGDADAILSSGVPIFAVDSPILPSGNFISPMLNAANEPSAAVIGPAPLPASPSAGSRRRGLVTVHHPVQFAGLNVQQQPVHGNLRADERAVPDDVASLDDILPFAAEHAEEFVEVFRQEMPFDARAP